MNKYIYCAAIALLFVAFSFSANAQCDRPSKGDYTLLIGKENTAKKKSGQLIIAAVQQTENAQFPFFVEWRSNSSTGEVLKSGYIKSNSKEAPSGKDVRILENLSPGTYYAVVYDSSENCKKVMVATTIK